MAVGQRADLAAIRDGAIPIRGFDVSFEPSDPTGYQRMATDPPMEVGELPFATYLQAFDHGSPVIGIPVFTTRVFEHNQLMVRAGAGISTPRDLEGKRVSMGLWGTNPAVWLRGLLTHQYSLATERVIWVSHRPEYFADTPAPERYQVEPLASGETVDAAVEAGKIDAVARGRPSEATPSLFADPYPEVIAYHRQTEVFPPNTVLILRRDAVQRHPDLAPALLEAFTTAMRRNKEDIAKGTAPLGLSGLDLARLDREGVPLPDHGFRANFKSIQLMIAYAYEQGVIRHIYTPEQLFLLTDT
jgi:4,5-dihydroxyphthalate decarboxylase